MQTNTSHDVSTHPTTWEHQENPVHSMVVADGWSNLSPVPPQLPPPRIPYYQEIESDHAGVKYEIPLKSNLSQQDEKEKGELDKDSLSTHFKGKTVTGTECFVYTI